MDERYAAVDVVGKGLVLFSAYDTRICFPCSVLTSTFVKLFSCRDRECRQGRCLHVQTSGIHSERALFAISVPRYTEPAQIIGGLHLAGPELIERIPPTIDFLSRSLAPSPTPPKRSEIEPGSVQWAYTSPGDDIGRLSA